MFVHQAPTRATRCGQGHLTIEVSSQDLATVLARMDTPHSSERVYLVVRQALEQDATLREQVAAMTRPSHCYTLDGAPRREGNGWRVDFTAYVFDDEGGATT